MGSESEHLDIRLARITLLIKELEKACSQREELRQTFLKLKQEMEGTTQALKPRR